jgi:hypothetical protein
MPKSRKTPDLEKNIGDVFLMGQSREMAEVRFLVKVG